MKPYLAEITFDQGGDNESTHYEDCDTLDEAVRKIEWWACGMGIVRAWINDREVRIRYGAVIGSDGDRFCTSPMWHEAFAPKHYPRVLPLMNRITHLNPQTYIDLQKPLIGE